MSTIESKEHIYDSAVLVALSSIMAGNVARSTRSKTVIHKLSQAGRVEGAFVVA